MTFFQKYETWAKANPVFVGGQALVILLGLYFAYLAVTGG